MSAPTATVDEVDPDWALVEAALERHALRLQWLRAVVHLHRAEPERLHPTDAAVRESLALIDSAVSVATVIGCEIGRQR